MSTVITTACIVVLAGLVTVALGAVFGRVHPLIDLFGQFLLPAMIAAAIAAVLATALGRYGFALAFVATFVASLAIAWPWLQTPAPEQAAGPRIKLLLLNVFVYNPRLDLVEKLVRESDADVVVLLEMIPRVRTKLSGIDNVYPHKLECWAAPMCDALILSRYPLTDLAHQLPQPKTRRSLASVRVDVNGRPLNLFAAHLTLPFPFYRDLHRQRLQAEDVAEAVRATQGPRLLVGDFNAATWGATMAAPRERAALKVLTGPGGTWPSFLPRHAGIPIDHVLASADLALLSRRVVSLYGTDHRAVFAEIAFRE